jgi:hypothetical protein
MRVNADGPPGVQLTEAGRPNGAVVERGQDPGMELAAGDRASRMTRNAMKPLVRAILWFSITLLLVGGILLRWLSLSNVARPFGRVGVDLLGSIGTALIVSAVVTGLGHLFMLRYYDKFEHESVHILRDDVEGKLSAIRDSIKRQTERFVHSVSSLQAMNQSAAVRLYESRHEASDDIAYDLMAGHVRQIRLMAVSLNDFVRGMGPLHEAWRRLEDLIRGNMPLPEGVTGLDIKVLIIDPNCFGAALRSHGESRMPASIAGRLETETRETAEHLLDLQRNIARGSSGVSFELRLYRFPPIFFLCRTDSTSYVQPYYFWPSRHLEKEAPNPVLKYEGQPGEPWTASLHTQTEKHFNWIWDNAAVPAEEVIDGKQVGLDRGASVNGIVNIFDDPQDALDRMLYLLANAKREVALQGISLDSFFNQGKPLFEAIAKLVERHDVKVRCLLLDPQSEQARLRAYREQLFVHPGMNFGDYSDEFHRRSTLFNETNSSLNSIIMALQPRADGNFEARLTSSAPSCFMLQVDDTVVAEQYHYGKINEGGDKFPVILGKQMPIVEFTTARSEVYSKDPMRDPVRLLENHFDFVFEHFSRPIEDAAAGLT